MSIMKNSEREIIIEQMMSQEQDKLLFNIFVYWLCYLYL